MPDSVKQMAQGDAGKDADDGYSYKDGANLWCPESRRSRCNDLIVKLPEPAQLVQRWNRRKAAQRHILQGGIGNVHSGQPFFALTSTA